MALRWIDSFDTYATADFDLHYEKRVGAPAITGSGRNGSGLSITDANSPFRILSKVFADYQATWIVGFALNIITYSGADKEIMQIVDGPGAVTHVTMWYQNSTNKLYLSGAWGSTLGTTVISAGTWYYVEVKVTIDNSAGAYEFRVNNTVEASASGVDTNNGGSNSANVIALRAGGSTSTSRERRFDDYYICDGSGSAPYNDFLGDCRVEAIFPSGDGATSGMTGSDGNSVNNSLLVDETNENADTDYVESSSSGTKDTYAMTNVTPTSGSVYAVMPIPIAKKTNAGDRSVKSVARLSSTEVDSAATTLSTDYAACPDIRTTKPGGGVWTITDVNAAEFGVKVA